MGCCLFRGGRGLRRGIVSIGRRHVDVNAHGNVPVRCGLLSDHVIVDFVDVVVVDV